jgi:nucleoid-associated protein YgaU
MAKETKVGLLAGLAFVICFAIILSNRGQRPPAGFADLTTGRDRSQPRQAAQNRPAGPAAAVRPSATDRAAQPVGNVSLNVGLTKDRPGALGELRQPGNGAAASTADDSPPSTGGSLVVDEPRTVQRPPSTTAAASPAPNDRKQVLRDRLDQIAADRGSKRPGSAPVDRTVDPATALNAATTHRTATQPQPAVNAANVTVQPGDTLSSIASRQYGSRGHHFIDGIVDANRAVINDPNRIRPGMELMLPVINGVKPAAAGRRAARDVPNPQGPSPSAPAKAARWYQIRPNDRYVTIAREQLGDGSRWREIYELNVDKFPDPGLIRAGVRIMLPAEEVVSRTPGSRP